MHRFQFGDCGEHTVTDATRHLHAKLTPLDRCPHWQLFRDLNNMSSYKYFRCIITREFVCKAPHSAHKWHDYNYNAGAATYPNGYGSVPADDGGEQSDAGDGSPDCDTCTSASECSTCSSDGDESTSTDGSYNCASCTSTSECSACDSTNTETASTSTSTSTAPGLYPVGVSLATVNGQEMPSLAPGDSHTEKLITKAGGYAIVHWYLLPPGDSRTYGDELFPTTYAQGPTVGTEVTFSFTIPSGARGGVYKLTAYIYPHSSAADQTCYEYSYFIYVS